MAENNNDNVNRRKFNRQFIRPGYRPSMVSSQTAANWRRRAILLQNNGQSSSANKIIGNYISQKLIISES